ncbi:hypothetical protein Clacol_002625 [Clathrus columnatus]|uniref:Uncharacterized protein n=1 Tax=Clathrus columnatus TaxID=1419009 RepID=A0AAV5A6P5_9AGAM|nr:hypothetical protein Clacol_002625 [Clathrus columnatus]
MSADALCLRIPVESKRRTRSSLNSLIQNLFYTPEWLEDQLDLNLHSFGSQQHTLQHDTTTCYTSSRSSRESLASTTTEISETKSMWFNDSPRNSIVELADDEASISTFDSHVRTPTGSHSLYFGSEVISALLSGTHSRSSSLSLARSSNRSPVFVLPDADSGCYSIQSSSEIDTPLSDCLDDELLSSPLESFAAICWSSAVKTDGYDMGIPAAEEAAETRENEEAKEEEEEEESFDFYNPLQYDQYNDDDFTTEDEYSSGMDILSIEYKPVASEVAPWMHVPKKALTILDFPEDHDFLLKNYNRDSAGPPHRMTIAGKCRKMMKSITKELSV